VVFRIAAPTDWQAAKARHDLPAGHQPSESPTSGGDGHARLDVRRALMALGGFGAAALVFALLHMLFSGQPRALAWLLGMGAALASLSLLAFRGGSATGLFQAGTHRVTPPQAAQFALLALAWGSAPWLMGVTGDLPVRLLLAVTLVAVAGAGAYLLAANRWAVLLWLGLVLGPLLVATWAEASAESTSIAALLLAAACAICAFALQLGRLLLEAQQTKSSNDALVRELRQQVALVEQANRDKSRFLAAASHDLRQPMHALGLFAASLEKSLAYTSLQPTVVNMLRAVDALEQSCSAMLDLSKLDAGVVEPNIQSFPIRDLFRRLHMHCAGQAEELGLALRFKPGGKIVTSDPQLLERVLSNLIHNAIRYTNQGGIVVLVRNRARRISIEVWDTGLGIAPEELPRVFDEFYQISNSGRDRTRGLGMGLAIVKRLVMLMGHELEVQSRPGRGSVFRILLKHTEMADMDSMVLGAETVPEIVDLNRTALVIDDEESIRVGMRDLLHSWGFEVLLAATIAEACAEVRRHAGVIDIVLSDLRLANSEDGVGAIERVRRVYGAPLPAVLITGDTSPDEVKRAHDSGHQLLFKPVRTRELYALLRGVP
jgi:signal transduction histidine kinase